MAKLVGHLARTEMGTIAMAVLSQAERIAAEKRVREAFGIGMVVMD